MITSKTGSGKPILVTGGAGLLGNELMLQLLNRGESVLAIQHATAITINHPNLRVETCSINDIMGLTELMQEVDGVYHCAGKVSFLPSEKRSLYKVNVEGTANLVEACLSASVRKLIHVSSVAVLEKRQGTDLITEDMLWSGSAKRSAYGESKQDGELEVWRGAAEGLEMAIVNPSIILGEGNWDEGSTALFKNVYNEFPWYSEGVNGFVDVKDVARLMIMLMESDVSNERFIISAENISYQQLFEKIAAAFHKRPPHKKITPFLAGLAWRVERLKYRFSGKKPLVTRETATTALRESKYCNQKILNAFPEFSFTSIDETIKRVAGSLQQKLNKP